MKYLLLITSAILLIAIPSQAATNANTSGAISAETGCGQAYDQDVLSVAGAINAGTMHVWSQNPMCGIARSNTQVLQWTGRFMGPVLTNIGGVIVPTATWAFTNVVGCTIATPTALTDFSLAASGSSAQTTITMTSNECRAVLTFTFSITQLGAVVFQSRPQFSINIQVEQPNFFYGCAAPEITMNAFNPSGSVCQEPIINNFNYLCDAPGIAPESFVETTTVCNDLALTGTFTLSGIPDTQQEIQAIADALAAGLDVNICPISSPCYQVLSGELDIHQDEACGATIPCQLEGNIGFTGSFNFTNIGNTTIEPGFTDTEEFQQAMWLFLFFIFLIILAEWKKDMIYYLIAIVVGISVMSVIDVIGVPRLGVVALIIYLIMRCYKVSKDARNTTDKEN